MESVSVLKKRPAVRIVLVTAPGKDAERIARTLLKERLIACANLLPRVKSLYWWKGKIESGAETLIVMKTSTRKVVRLLKRVKAIHPYEVPEFLTIQVDEGSLPYVQWLLSEC
jgi:periplasmic divalent cation tolerance protein